MKRAVQFFSSVVMVGVIAFLTLLFASTTSHAAYPESPISLIVPVGTGTNSDVASRLIAERLSDKLNTAVVVENRPGAGGNIGANFVAKAAPDGYTLLFGSNATNAANVTLFQSIPYDPSTDFVPLAFIGWTPMVVLVRADHPAKTLQELVEQARTQSETINVAIPSTSSRVVLLEINHIAKTEMETVLYKNSSVAMNDLLGGHIPVSIDTVAASLPMIQAGKLRALAVSTPARSDTISEIPTMVESSFEGFKVSPWNIIYAPKGTEQDIVDRLHTALTEVLAEPKVRESLRERNGLVFGAEMDYSVSDLKKFNDTEIKTWRRIILDAGIERQ